MSRVLVVGDSCKDVFIYGDTYAQSFNGVEISVVGSTLTFTVAGIGSTSLTLS